jgi:hypothetical protein
VEYIPLLPDRGQHGRQGRKEAGKGQAKALASVRQAPVKRTDPLKVAADIAMSACIPNAPPKSSA